MMENIFADLDKSVNRLTELEKENISLKLELARLENQLDIEREVKSLQKSPYYTVKDYFLRVFNCKG